MTGDTSGSGSPRAMRSAMPWMSEPAAAASSRFQPDRAVSALMTPSGPDGVAETGEMVELGEGGLGGVAAGPGHERVALVEDPEDGRDARVRLALVGVAVVAVAGDGGLRLVAVGAVAGTAVVTGSSWQASGVAPTARRSRGWSSADGDFPP